MQTNEYAVVLFHRGDSTKAYEYFGCHLNRIGREYRYIFRVWAEHARKIEVIGDFNGWKPFCRMERITGKGIFEYILTSSVSLQGSRYKYRITSAVGVADKADPYAVYAEYGGEHASVIYDSSDFHWTDAVWRNRRCGFVGKRTPRQDFYPAPMNIYEVHLGSWKKPTPMSAAESAEATASGQVTKPMEATASGQVTESAEATASGQVTESTEATASGRSADTGTGSSGLPPQNETYLNYRELADLLSVYVRQMGYTHVELLPVMEHPYDGSWGYQISGYYSPTSRFGTPDDFRYFVNRLHKDGIGVILDWVPAHFTKDAYGLTDFDGEPLYEYADPYKKEHPIWGTRFFDLSKPEVIGFLISNALYWLREFHVDGLRVDAVAAMLYLDYDRQEGQWQRNEDGGSINADAVTFLQKLNAAVAREFPDVLMIAEESTAFPKVTVPTADGGLGFHFKWNMGFANDSFAYMETDPYFRKYQHHCLTFPMMYSLGENYILPVSHDEVVHGKKSLLDKMFGDYGDKFASEKLFVTYMMCYPGKKLFFMGYEYGQFAEWDWRKELEWFMLNYDSHRNLRNYHAALNRFYLTRRELWELDFTWDGFEWLFCDRREDNVIAFRRLDKRGNELVAVFHFSPVVRENYPITGLSHRRYTEVWNSDDARYGGSGNIHTGSLDAEKQADSETYTLSVTLYGLSAILLKPVLYDRTAPEATLLSIRLSDKKQEKK